MGGPVGSGIRRVRTARNPQLAHRGGRLRPLLGPSPRHGVQRRPQRGHGRQPLRSLHQPVRPGRRPLAVRRQHHLPAGAVSAGVGRPPAAGIRRDEKGQGGSARRRVHADRTGRSQPLQRLEREEPADRDDADIGLVGRSSATPARPSCPVTAHTVASSPRGSCEGRAGQGAVGELTVRKNMGLLSPTQGIDDGRDPTTRIPGAVSLRTPRERGPARRTGHAPEARAGRLFPDAERRRHQADAELPNFAIA
jgi:hypothetical protein